MNIDERLEALTQSVELLTHDIREMQAGIAEQKKGIDKLTDACFALLTIAGNHEKRLQRLEGQNGSKPGEET